MSWRKVNFWAAVAWAAVVPVAHVVGLIHNLTFISDISLYAIIVSHIAAWRADVPDTQEEEEK